MSLEVRVDRHGDQIQVRCPYDPEFVELARDLDGKFNQNGRVWVFDARDADRVRQALGEVFGEDGNGPVPTVDVQVDLNRLNTDIKELRLFGRQVAVRRFKRDRVWLGEKVVVIRGGFPDRGGSEKYPRVEALEGTVLEVRDVPRSRVQAGGLLEDGEARIVREDDESGTDYLKRREAWLVGELEKVRSQLDRLGAGSSH